MVFDGFQVARYIETGQSHQFRSQIESNVQYSSHAVRVKEWQQANVGFLVAIFNIRQSFFLLVIRSANDSVNFTCSHLIGGAPRMDILGYVGTDIGVSKHHTFRHSCYQKRF